MRAEEQPMKRKREHETRVWRDPNIQPGPQADQHDREERAPADADVGSRRAGVAGEQRQPPPQRRRGARIIAGPAAVVDERELEREQLLARLLAAEGRPLVSQACEDYLAAGFELPPSQQLWLQLLEHNDEERLMTAIAGLALLFDEEAPKRRAVLQARLRRIEEYADDVATQQAASDLRRKLAASK